MASSNEQIDDHDEEKLANRGLICNIMTERELKSFVRGNEIRSILFKSIRIFRLKSKYLK
jgi:hypothetical protein